MFDGAIARARGRSSRFGAFLDSTVDRIADGAVFGSLAYWLAVSDRRHAAAAALVCLVTGQIVSYAKARAEGLGVRCDVGFAERSERLILLGLGGIAWLAGVPYAFEVSLWLIGALSVYTIGQRVVHVWRAAGHQEGADHQEEAAGRRESATNRREETTGEPVGKRETR